MRGGRRHPPPPQPSSPLVDPHFFFFLLQSLWPCFAQCESAQMLREQERELEKTSLFPFQLRLFPPRSCFEAVGPAAPKNCDREHIGPTFPAQVFLILKSDATVCVAVVRLVLL